MWEVTVEGDSIIVRRKWMEAAFFAPNEVIGEIRAFTCIFDTTKIKRPSVITQQTVAG